MAISGVGVAALSAGALLIYAGLQDINPLEALKQIASGKPVPVSKESKSSLGTAAGSTAADLAGRAWANGQLSGLAAIASSKYGADLYSQSKRSQQGYSDCSSFTSKAMRSYVPGFPMLNTGGFLFSTDWISVSEKNARPGDIALNGAHMAIVGGRNTKGELIGIGQQNPKRNVHTDTIKNLMANTGPYTLYRYKKKNLSQAPGQVNQSSAMT